MPTQRRTALTTRSLSFRINQSERDNIQASAANCAMSVGEYCRRQTLNKVIVSRFDMQAIAELRRQGGLLKHLHNNGFLHKLEVDEIVKTITALINRVEVTS